MVLELCSLGAALALHRNIYLRTRRPQCCPLTCCPEICQHKGEFLPAEGARVLGDQTRAELCPGQYQGRTGTQVIPESRAHGALTQRSKQKKKSKNIRKWEKEEEERKWMKWNERLRGKDKEKSSEGDQEGSRVMHWDPLSQDLSQRPKILILCTLPLMSFTYQITHNETCCPALCHRYLFEFSLYLSETQIQAKNNCFSVTILVHIWLKTKSSFIFFLTFLISTGISWVAL